MKFGTKDSNKLAIFLILVLLVTISLFVSSVLAEPKPAEFRASEDAINRAFSGVLSAEKAGGDVSKLLNELESAGTLMVEAEIAYMQGDIIEAVKKTDNARVIAESVFADASTLQDLSVVEWEQKFLLNAIFSIVGSAIFLGVLFLFWKRFKTVYAKNLSGLAPEVI